MSTGERSTQRERFAGGVRLLHFISMRLRRIGCVIAVAWVTWSLEASAEDVSIDAFRRSLDEAIDKADAPWIDSDRARFCTKHQLSCEAPEFVKEFKRVRLLFEATRDGGFFRLRWQVTNKEPSSADIFRAWQKVRPLSVPSATAECDELSALFAYLARGVGVADAGLWWPRWNHVVSLWKPKHAGPNAPTVMLPTSQIFLACDQSFDSNGFGTAPKKVNPYVQRDLKGPVSRELVNALTGAISTYAPLRPALLDAMRLHRAERYDSSTDDCTATRATLISKLSALTPGESTALLAYAKDELGLETKDPQDVLRILAAPRTAAARKR